MSIWSLVSCLIDVHQFGDYLLGQLRSAFDYVHIAGSTVMIFALPCRLSTFHRGIPEILSACRGRAEKRYPSKARTS